MVVAEPARRRPNFRIQAPAGAGAFDEFNGLRAPAAPDPARSAYRGIDMSIVHVQWEGPLDRESAISRREWRVDRGVYQVYGAHPVYGADSLLYIGKTDGQTFGQRVAQHEWWLGRESAQGEPYFFLGRLAGSFTPIDADWLRQIAHVEALLIVSQKPLLSKLGCESG